MEAWWWVTMAAAEPVITSRSTHARYRGQGFATALVQHAAESLVRQGIEKILVRAH